MSELFEPVASNLSAAEIASTEDALYHVNRINEKLLEDGNLDSLDALRRMLKPPVDGLDLSDEMKLNSPIRNSRNRYGLMATSLDKEEESNIASSSAVEAQDGPEQETINIDEEGDSLQHLG